MIDVTTETYGIHVQGHSNMAPKGSDLVCAATSALVYAFIRNIEDAKKAKIARRVTIKISDGDVFIRCKPCRGWEATLAIIIRTSSTGFAVLAEQYPQFIQIRV